MNDGTWAWLFWYLLVFAGILGMLIGSFLNVVIYRVPAGLSVVSPASRCPVCETPIRWYDNIPVFSWLWLRAKCRTCKTPISARYAGVELLVGVLAAIFWWQVGGNLRDVPQAVDISLAGYGVVFATRLFLGSLLVAITFVDLDHFIIPHSFTIPGMVVGLAAPWIFQWMFGFPQYLSIWPPVSPLASIVGFFTGGLIILFVFYFYLAARGVEGLGGGDLTMMAMLGAWFGPAGVIFVLFASSVQGVLIAGITTLLGIEFVTDSREIFDDEEGEKEQAETDAASEDGAEEGEGEDASGEEEAEEEGEEEGGHAAVPFGPFIALAAWEYLILGPYLPDYLSMATINLML